MKDLKERVVEVEDASNTAPRHRPRTIYIDCTDTFFRGLNTGIQRVVRNMVNRAKYLEETFGIRCVPVVFAFGSAWGVTNFQRISRLYRTKQKLYRFARALFHRAGLVAAYVVGLVASLLPEGRVKSLLKTFYSSARGLAKEVGKKVMFLINLPLLLLYRPVGISRGDMLLAPDAFWSYNITDYLRELAHRGVFTVTVIYDLIPISYPQYCDENYVRTFSIAVDRMLLTSDGVIGISKTVRDEVRDYIYRKPVLSRKALIVDYFYLGANFENEIRKTGQIRNWPPELWGKEKVYLMVGSIEPRKGYDFVLTAFEKMWAQGSEARLLIVGRVGWRCADIVERIRNSPYLNSRLFAFHDINDDELLYCYEHSTALIFASRVEGFGLPLVEAMERGIPVVASDIPVFREIGGDYPVYFSLNSVDSLISALKKVSTRRPERRRWISWDESVTTLMKKALRIYAIKKQEQEMESTDKRMIARDGY